MDNSTNSTPTEVTLRDLGFSPLQKKLLLGLVITSLVSITQFLTVLLGYWSILLVKSLLTH